jgi:hypothetical protein
VFAHIRIKGMHAFELVNVDVNNFLTKEVKVKVVLVQMNISNRRHRVAKWITSS